MDAPFRHFLVELLLEYRGVFAFGSEDMPSIDLAIMERKLNVDPTHKLVIQKK